jgi:ribonuclease Z
VEVEGGRVVQPSEVMEDAQPGPVLLLLDCPTEGHAAELQHAPVLQQLAARPVQAGQVKLVMHMSPVQVRCWRAGVRWRVLVLDGT